jgi:glycosyltransferase involved in cell wall biosynthesis
MRFLYAAIAYPDIRNDTNMYTALVHELAGLNHQVRVIAPTFQGHTRKTIEGGIPVLRVKSGPLFDNRFIVKGVNTLLLNPRYRKAMQRFWPDWAMDWVIASTPPITLSPFIQRLKTRFNAKLYLILRDIFPQNARDLGIIKDPLLFAYFRHKEKHLYKISDIIGCMSPGNIAFVRKQDRQILKGDKLTYFPNWVKPTPKDSQRRASNSFRKRFNLEGNFIALFGGNFGKPQQTEFILDLAKRVNHLPDVVFCLIGDGTEKERIRKLVDAQRLDNVALFDRLPHNEYQTLIYEVDIGLVNLSQKFTIPNIPSRTLGYWDASLPVLAATDRHTDLNKNLLEKYNAGLWAETGNLDDYYVQFMKLYQDPKLRKKMGRNGRKAVETDFSVQTAARRLLTQASSTRVEQETFAKVGTD